VGVAAVAAGAFTVLWARSGDRVEVLALARPVVLGQLLGEGDVKVVALPAGSGVAVLPVSARERVVGEPVAESLPAGTLLAGQMLGGSPVALGQSQVSVLVKEGRFPSGLADGDQVAVLDAGAPAPGAASGASGSPGGSGASGGSGAGVVQAVVVDVRAASDGSDGGGSQVVTLLCAQSGAPQVAGFADPALVLLPAAAGGR